MSFSNFKLSFSHGGFLVAISRLRSPHRSKVAREARNSYKRCAGYSPKVISQPSLTKTGYISGIKKPHESQVAVCPLAGVSRLRKKEHSHVG